MNRVFLLATLLLAACGPDQVPATAPEPAAVDQQPQVGSTAAPLTGFPCDVRDVLQANCAGCHAGGVYIRSFASRADFLQPIQGTTLLGAEVALRLRPGAQAPMPPERSQKQPTAAERQLLEGWIQAGMPAGECGPLLPR